MWTAAPTRDETRARVTDKDRLSVLTGLGSTLCFVGFVLAIVSVSSTVWSDSRDSRAPRFHTGLFELCNFSPENSCARIQEQGPPVYTNAQYNRIVGVRFLMIAALVLGFVATTTAMLAVGARRYYSASSALGSGVACGVVATVMALCALIIFGDVQDDGLQFITTPGDPSSLMRMNVVFGWSFDLAVATTILYFFGTLALSAALSFATPEVVYKPTATGLPSSTPRGNAPLLNV